VVLACGLTDWDGELVGVCRPGGREVVEWRVGDGTGKWVWWNRLEVAGTLR